MATVNKKRGISIAYIFASLLIASQTFSQVGASIGVAFASAMLSQQAQFKFFYRAPPEEELLGLSRLSGTGVRLDSRRLVDGAALVRVLIPETQLVYRLP